MDTGTLLTSFSEEQQHAIRQVVVKRLKRSSISLHMAKSYVSPTKKKGNKNKVAPPQSHASSGCCFNEKLEAINHREMVELAPDCFAFIPRVVVHMISFLDKRRDVEGIFRISGTNRRLKLLRQTVCQQPIDDDAARPVSPHDVACLLKHFFRDIPGLLLSKECLHDMMAAADRHDKDDASLARVILDLCLLLPELTLTTLRYVATFFNRVASDSHCNKMPIDNLACVLTPNLMGPAGPGLVLSRQTKVVSLLLTFAMQIGLVSREQAVAAQKMTGADTGQSSSAQSHYLRSSSKKYSADGVQHERRPLGTINNFVFSIASRLANPRRASMSTSHRHVNSTSLSSGPVSSATQTHVSTSSTQVNAAAGNHWSEPTLGSFSRGKRRAPAPCHELSPPAKKHSDTNLARRQRVSLGLPRKNQPATRAKSLPFGRGGVSDCGTGSVQSPTSSLPFQSQTSTSSTSDAEEANSPDSERHVFADDSNTSCKSLSRTSATRIACHRSNIQTRRALQRCNAGEVAEMETENIGTGCPWTVDVMEPPDSGSSLASAALSTTERIIGRSMKLGDLCAKSDCSALDVSDISIHLPSLAGDPVERQIGNALPSTPSSISSVCGLV